ncbi:hypothetical protein ACFYVL_28760 [Streptomyces sp. NPDC004111]|uniref:hypothetical protein n=1 Tax=Streptomyces sp. NPDC004111 TaxID=3364690 RepID=UPI0036AEB8F4
MLRHEFQPGRAVLGLTFLGATALYAADVTGAWDTPWWVLIPVVCVGLAVASFLGLVAYSVRRRRRARIASSENTVAPASTSGSQAMR